MAAIAIGWSVLEFGPCGVGAGVGEYMGHSEDGYYGRIC
jgi:hypothetical protein